MTDRTIRVQVCDAGPDDWQCLRDAGHSGPCALTPLAGSGACPDIDRCLVYGCQGKCGLSQPREVSLSAGIASAFRRVFGKRAGGEA
jgi:hypothetical protein